MKIIVWLFLCLVWGSTWIFIKIGLVDLPPLTFSSARFIFALLILFIIIRIRKIPFPTKKNEWKLIAVTGFFQFSINYSAVFWGEQYISSGLAAVLQAMITVFGLILAWFFLPGEKITKLKITAVLVGITGVAVIFLDQLKIRDFMAFAGCVAIVIGAYCAAQSSILIKAKGGLIHPAMLLFCQMLCGIPPVVVYALLVEGNPLYHQWTTNALLSVLYLTLFGTILAFWFYYWLLGKIESTKAMMIALVTPLLAVLIGAIFLGERLPPQTFLGGILILSSIGLIVFRRKPEPVLEKQN